MSALEQIVVTGCPTCGALAQAIAEGEGVRYRHIDAATLKAVQGGVTEGMVERACVAYYDEPAWKFMSHKAGCKDRMRAALEAALSDQGQGEAVEDWQRKCPDFPNCPNLGCPCEPRETVDSIVPDDAHHAFVVGPSTYTHVRLSQRGFDLARAAFGATSAEDDARVYRAIQAYIYTAPPAQSAERVPDGWKLAMSVLQSDLFAKLPEEERAVCEALIAENPYINLPASPAPSPARGDGFYLASFKHGPCGGHMQWWGPNNCGYTPDLDQAGVYTTDQIKPGYHDSDHTVPVPVALIDRFRVRRMLDVADTLNAPLHSAEALRAWIATTQDTRP